MGKAASPITYSDSNGKSDAWGKTDFSNVACRYVKATLKSSASTSTMMLIDEIKVMGEFHNDMKYVPEKGVIMEHSHHYTDSIRKTAKEVLTSVPLPYLKNWWESNYL